MKTMRIHWLVLSCVLSFLGSRSALAQQVEPTSARIEVIQSDAEAVVLEFHLGNYTIESQERAKVLFYQIRADGMEQSASPDFPQVPTLGTMIGIPTTANTAIEIIDFDAVEVGGYSLGPAPQYALAASDLDGTPTGELIERFDLQPNWQGRDAFLPQTPVNMGQSGTIRDQPVAQIQFYPVRYNPASRQLKIYRRIRARIIWGQVTAHFAQPLPDSGSAYEALLQTSLVNYAQVEQMQRRFTARPVGTATSAASEIGADGATDKRGDLPFQIFVSFAGTGKSTYVRLAKVVVVQDGFYKITGKMLANKEINLTEDIAPTSHLAMINGHNEREIAIDVQTDGDSNFDSDNDFILFYGTKLRNDGVLPGVTPEHCPDFNEAKPDHWYAEENVYWLVLMEQKKGRRIGEEIGTPDGDPPAVDFPVGRHFEEDTRYWQTMPGQECEDRWFWGQRLSDVRDSSVARRDFPLGLGAIATGSATVSVTLKGYSTSTQNVDIWLNGTSRPAELLARERKTVSFQAQLAQAGTPTQTVTVKAGTDGSGLNQFYVDSIEMQYRQRYSANSQNQFIIGKSSSSAETIQITGLSEAVSLYDISESLYPVRIDVEPMGGKLEFRSVASDQVDMIACQGDLYRGKCYLAVAETAFKEPEIEAVTPTALMTTANSAKYVIVTHEDFVAAAQTLADHRAGIPGLITQVVTVSDIYDEFNYGIANPAAIRDFLDYAYHCWDQQHKLEYVLFMGDANQDYKNRLGNSINYVPSFNFESSLFGEISSDSWFANMVPSAAYDCANKEALESQRDTLPDLFIGRIPVSSLSQANEVIAKIRTYERPPIDERWQQEVLFVTDDEVKFRTAANEISRTVPSAYNISKIAVKDMDEDENVSGQNADAMANRIIDAFNSGKLLINYVGHGDHNAWGRWDAANAVEHHYILHANQLEDNVMPDLNNLNKLPVVTVSNCLNGFFAGPNDNPSLAETLLLNSGGGAVAVWAPTGLGLPSGHQVMMSKFNEAIFAQNGTDTQHKGRELGVAAQHAFIQTYVASNFWGEMALTYVLFGDPAMKIGIYDKMYFPVR